MHSEPPLIDRAPDYTIIQLSEISNGRNNQQHVRIISADILAPPEIRNLMQECLEVETHK